ncbi:hypothetical protein GCM10007860_11100 [Chitiniphilus shinanonensis]|uniref:YecA family protein n=1 Tax=Chitiniphilus shinanonensis TaxID=553088 RepID=A0ABQ6BR66_9NEIS|nr:UPF0149 family protein [Chitiniphilus shinanonensis]GLS03964.1 hypothetical protein GCM10007860_11100 [Chitiniphilus shinanonensis]
MANKGYSQATVAPLTDTELDELAAFLDSDATPEECMDLSMLHGYLTALLISPDEPLPDTWLPPVWGDGSQRPRFDSPAQQTHIEDLVLRLYNQLSDELSAEPPAFTPMVYVDEDSGTDIAQQWCYGFMLGTSLDPDSWQPLLEDEDGIELIGPILDCADEESRADMEAEGENLVQFEHQLAAALPELIPTIRDYWRQRAEHAAKPARPGRRH